MGRPSRKSLRPAVTIDDVQAAVWRLTGWRGEPGKVDRLLRVIEEYALCHGAVIPGYNSAPNTEPHKIMRPPELAPSPAPPPAPARAPAAVETRVAAAVKTRKAIAKGAASTRRLIRCNHCGKFWDFADMVSDTRRPDGVRTICRQCSRNGTPLQPEYAKQRVYSDMKLVPDKKFRCQDCGHDFAYKDMRKDARRPDGVRSRCLTCEQNHVKQRQLSA